MKTNTKNFLFLILIVLNFFDFQTTLILINALGPTVEANPLLVWLFTATGTFYVVLLVKALFLILLGYCINHRKMLLDNTIIVVLGIVNIWYFAVVMGNFYLINLIGI